MKYIVDTEKDIETATRDLEEAVANNNFGVLHIHNLKATMQNKGVDFPNHCRIFEVCNPHKAKEVLSSDMSLNMALPCRISVWEEEGKVKIGTIKPSAMLSMLNPAEELQVVAKEVEETMIKIIEEAR